ncbi:Uncharacterised protein [Comamonas aquatica]|uniref:Uncharacterized protein n=1 Tax=Comamonas aquatica TaxID=225991 RepID=A0AA35D739_9BURK|nr:Uncharacterised protein [Comamonas aquatica]
MLAGARGFHRRVQRQDVGLEGDAVDHADDVGNLLAAGIDALHGLHHLAHGLAAFGDHALGFARALVGGLGVVGVVGHGGTQLLHGGGGLFQGAGLAFGAGGQVLVALGDFGAGQGHAVGLLVHGADHAGQAGAGVVHGLQQVTDLVLAVAVDAHGEVTFGNRVGHAAGFVQGAHDHAADQPEPHGRQHQHRAQAHGGELQDQRLGFGSEFIHVGAGGEHPVPRRVVAEDGQLLARLRLAGVGPGVGDAALLAVQHVADEEMAVAVLRIADVLAFLRGVHHQLAALRAILGAQHEVVAALADLQAADRGLEVVQQFREILAHKGDADGGARSVLERAVVRHVLAAEQVGQAHVALPRLDGSVGRVGTVQQTAQGGFALLVLQRGGDAQEVTLALGREHGGHGAGAACEALDVHVVAVEQLAIQAEQRLAAAAVQGERALQAARQAVGQELGALAQVLVVGLNEALQHLDALLHLAVHLGLQGMADPPGNAQDQQPQDGRDPDKIGDRQLGAQPLTAPKTLADVHRSSPSRRSTPLLCAHGCGMPLHSTPSHAFAQKHADQAQGLVNLGLERSETAARHP